MDINCACNIASVVDNCLPSVVDTIASLIYVYIILRTSYYMCIDVFLVLLLPVDSSREGIVLSRA